MAQAKSAQATTTGVETARAGIGPVAGAQETVAPPEKPPKSERKFASQSIHLVRTAQTQTLGLSSMADNKASILIGATFVVFSMSITRILGEGTQWSVLALSATAFFSSLFAVFAVLPSVGRIKRDNPGFNHLFFGHYSQMEIEQWTDEVLERMETDEDLFRTMLRDVHQGGSILAGRKYRYLSYAYRIFIAGVFITWCIFTYETMLA